MIDRLKKLFYWMAYIDIEHTCTRKETYFGRFPQEIALRNLSMVRSISIFLSIVCLFVIGSTFFFAGGVPIRYFYLVALALELGFIALCTVLTKRPPPPIFCTVLTCLFLLHMLAISGYIGVVNGQQESASIFMAALVISSTIFALPPILSTCLVAIATVGVLFGSFWMKDPLWFRSDLLNCIGVFLLSILVGWRTNKIRVEEAFSRADVLKLNHDLQRISRTDMLTGLPNHRSFQDTYYTMFDHAKTTATPIGVIMIDLDKFKDYNDNYGHIMGDECLAAVGSAFFNLANDDVKVCRYGGEEFVVLLRAAACDRALHIAEHFRHAVETLAIDHTLSKTGGVITASIGVYVGVPTQWDKPMLLVERADRAMYASKRDGRNRISLSKW